MTIQEAACAWINYLSHNGHSPRTIIIYKLTAESLADACHRLEVQDVSPGTLETWLETFDGLAPATRNLKKAALKSWFKWCQETGLITRNPAAILRMEKLPYHEAEYLDAAEVQALRNALTAAPHRDRLLVELFLQTGVRLAEAVALNVGSVRGKQYLHITGKGCKPRAVYINASLEQLIRVVVRGRSDSDPLFVSHDGARISRRRVQQIFKIWLRQAGIRKDIGVHGLRHTFGSHLYSKTLNLRLVSDLLGHSNPATTARYAHIGEASKREAVQGLYETETP